MPKISVIMSVFREPTEWIESSINSILEQTYDDFEFIIVNDNPESEELRLYLKGKALSDKRIVLISNERNIGLTKSLNVALEVVKGEYVARMDADDVALPERFEKQVNYMANSAFDLCFTSFYRINENGEIVSDYSNPDSSFLFWQNIYAHPSALWRRELISLRTPFYNEAFRRSQDYELWSFMLLKNKQFGYIDEPLLLYRESKRQISKAKSGEQIKDFKSIRRHLYVEYLKKAGIMCSCDEEDLLKESTIVHIYNKYDSLSDREKINIERILFVLNYSSNEKLKCFWKYILKKHGFLFKVPAKLALYYMLNLVGIDKAVLFSLY